MRGSTRLLRLALVVALASLVGVAAAEGPRRPGPTRLKAAVLPFLSYAPLFLAAEEGYFADRGLDVEFVRFTKSADAVVALVQGQIDVAGSILTVNMLSAAGRDARLRLVASRGYVAPTGCVYSGLVGRRALVRRGALDAPGRLKGLRLSFSEANLEGYYVDKLLAEAGLTTRDIGIQDLPDPAMAGALERGAIDVVATSEPWLTRLVASGHGAVWMPLQRLIPDSEFGLLQYGPTLLDRDPDAGVRFMAAYLKAVRQYNRGKTERNLEILARRTKLDRGLLGAACWPPFRDSGRVNLQSILDFQAWAVGKGLVDRALDAGDLWDPRFVEQASRLLGPAPAPP